ncbi:hypothetical protein [Melissospora conviva]|uniref:hypothetical protein n=1 Tax=Melissospora conviva TaxID=3388432 RepID=UPI003C190872
MHTEYGDLVEWQREEYVISDREMSRIRRQMRQRIRDVVADRRRARQEAARTAVTADDIAETAETAACAC